MEPFAALWPNKRSKTLDWLVNETSRQPYVDNLFGELCDHLAEEGIPIDRATVHMQTLHPQFWGATVRWERGKGFTFQTADHGATTSDAYRNSPVREIFEGADGLRQRLDLLSEPHEYSIFNSLAEQGYTDYVGAVLNFASGKRHATSWATRKAGGFSTDHLVMINEMLPVMAMAFEIRLNRRIAKNLLNTYVGERAGEAILNGNITRGSGHTVRAAIWNCDIRGFTQISEKWPRDDVIASLNEYFDAMAVPIAAHQGEILKFIGDGLLAIFPIEDDDGCACERAFEAARQAVANMRDLNRRRMDQGQSELGFGIALHVGDVMYGNIGSQSRLDFTVIGPAVNSSARLERLNKELRRRLLFSGPFVEMCPCGTEHMVRLGSYELRGVAGPMDVYGLKDEA